MTQAVCHDGTADRTMGPSFALCRRATRKPGMRKCQAPDIQRACGRKLPTALRVFFNKQSGFKPLV